VEESFGFAGVGIVYYFRDLKLDREGVSGMCFECVSFCVW
jgi:hypothetical protein